MHLYPYEDLELSIKKGFESQKCINIWGFNFKNQDILDIFLLFVVKRVWLRTTGL